MMALPDLPNFDEMPETACIHRLGDQGRSETAMMRKQFLEEMSRNNGVSKLVRDYRYLQQAKNSRQRLNCFEINRESKQTMNGDQWNGWVLDPALYRWKKKDLIGRPPFYEQIHVEARAPIIFPHGARVLPQSFFLKVPLRPKTGDAANHCHHVADVNFSAGREYVPLVQKKTRQHENCLQVYEPDFPEAEIVTANDARDNQITSIHNKRRPASNNIERFETNSQENRKNVRPCKSAALSKSGVTPISPNFQNGLAKTQSLIDKEDDSLKKSKHKGSYISTRSPFSKSQVPAEVRSKRHFIHPEWSSETMGWTRYEHASYQPHLRYSWM